MGEGRSKKRGMGNVWKGKGEVAKKKKKKRDH